MSKNIPTLYQSIRSCSSPYMNVHSIIILQPVSVEFVSAKICEFVLCLLVEYFSWTEVLCMLLGVMCVVLCVF